MSAGTINTLGREKTHLPVPGAAVGIPLQSVILNENSLFHWHLRCSFLLTYGYGYDLHRTVPPCLSCQLKMDPQKLTQGTAQQKASDARRANLRE